MARNPAGGTEPHDKKIARPVVTAVKANLVNRVAEKLMEALDVMDDYGY